VSGGKADTKGEYEMSKQTAANQAKNSLKTKSTDAIILAFDSIRTAQGEELNHVRGWIMDELESRNQDAFNAWLDSNEASPRTFYL
jgi:hypothetical protein